MYTYKVDGSLTRPALISLVSSGHKPTPAIYDRSIKACWSCGLRKVTAAVVGWLSTLGLELSPPTRYCGLVHIAASLWWSLARCVVFERMH